MASTRPTPRPAARPGSIRTGSIRPGRGPARADKSMATVVAELWQLTVAYAKQEIRDPLTGLASYVAWGVATMLLLGLGSVLLALGALRALQTETGSTFTGNLSWAPYGIVLAGSIVVLGIVGAIITRGKQR